MITDVKRERVAMTREEAITIMQLYKEELEHGIAKIDYDPGTIDLYSMHLDAFDIAIKALSAEVKENRQKPDYSYEADMVRRLKEALSAEGDLISRDVVLANIDERLRANGYGNVGLVSELNRLIGYVRNIPSAEAEDRLYIKIYADDEPSVKAEKLYQICDETQNREVAEWLKEYFPFVEPKTGEWIDKGNWMGIECSRCKCHSRYVTPFCPQCGAKMKGGDTE